MNVKRNKNGIRGVPGFGFALAAVRIGTDAGNR